MRPREDWEKFPIVIDGVNADQIMAYPNCPIPAYPYYCPLPPLDPNKHSYLDLPVPNHRFNQFADVVTRWFGFVPHKPVIPNDFWAFVDAAKKSFSWNDFLTYCSNANQVGLRVMWGLSWSATNLNQVGNDGMAVDTDLDQIPDQMWATSVPQTRIPVGLGAAVQRQITPEFVHYWSDRANVFIALAAQHSDLNSDVLWGWRVIEEPKYDPIQNGEHGNETDVRLSNKMRDLTNLHDNGRFRFTYTGLDSMPDADILWSLVEKGETKFELSPEDPIARREGNFNNVKPFYVDDMMQQLQLPLRVAGGTHLVQMFDHVASGAYMEMFKDYDDKMKHPKAGAAIAHTNRIFVYHRIRLGREALDNLASVYAATEVKKPPDHILFHVPGMFCSLHRDFDKLNPNGTPDPNAKKPDPMPPAHARHDLWAGVHEATGIFLYSFGQAHLDPPAWSEYVKALYLIKQTIRPYIIDGVKSHPENDFLSFIAPEEYISQLGTNRDDLTLPDGAQRYTAINLTLFRMGKTGYLIATNSVSSQKTLQVNLGDFITNADVVSGIKTNVLHWQNHTLFDTFSGIDGRVYEITFGADIGL